MTLAIVDPVPPGVDPPRPLVIVEGGENTAEAARQAAMAATSAAIALAASGPNYASTAAGLAATTSGEAFAVDNGDGTATIYLNDSGSALQLRSLILDPAAPTAAALLGRRGGSDVQAGIDAALASRQAQQLVQRLERSEDCNLIVLGDSTGDASDEWIFLLAEALGEDYPAYTVNYRAWDTGTDNYGAVTTVQTGAGSPPVLTVWNASIPGSTAQRFAGLDLLGALGPGSMGQDADLFIFSYGHNGGNDDGRQISLTSTIVGEASRAFPFVPIILIGQNPVTTDESMAEKVRVFRSFANALNLGWIDVHQYFKTKADPIGDYYLDTLHPDAAGEALWTEAVRDVLRLSINGAAGGPVSNISRGIVMVQDTYALLGGWTPHGCTFSQDLALFETSGESLKVTGDGATNGPYISRVVIPSNDILAYRNRWVTVTFRIRVPEGSDVTCGQVGLDDGTTTILSSNGGPQGTGFYMNSISLKVGSAATALTAFMWIKVGASTSTEFVHIDRVIVSDGPFTRDAQVLRQSALIDLSSVSGDIVGTLPIGRGGTGTTTATGTGDVVFSNGPTFSGTVTAADLVVAAATPILRTNASTTTVMHGLELRNGANIDASFKVQPNTAEARLSSGRSAGWGSVLTFYIDTAEVWRFESGGHFRPASDNTYQLGTAANRVKEVFAATGTINTSDEREKENIGAIPDAWLDVWAEVQWRRFKYRGGQRWHAGLIAQEVHAAFAAHGIDAFEIGLCCLDRWDEMREPVLREKRVPDEYTAIEQVGQTEAGEPVLAEVTKRRMEAVLEPAGEDEARRPLFRQVLRPAWRIEHEETGETRVVREAGERWGLRYDECQAVEAAWMRREVAKMAAA